jgi:hypothetical protein
VVTKSVPQEECDGDIYAVHFDGPTAFTSAFRVWYCPNKPIIEIIIDLLWYLMTNPQGGQVSLDFSPSSNAVNHSTKVEMNGSPVGTIPNTVPNGSYDFNFGSEAINQGLGTNAQQSIKISTQWPYAGDIAHYMNITSGDISISTNGVTVYVCAGSAEEARAIAEELLGIHELATEVNLQIERPNPGYVAPINQDGFINVKALVTDDLTPYYNSYTLSAEVKYLDQSGEPTETFALFDDGQPNHGDPVKNDRYFNALWAPKYGGEVHLKVTLTSQQQITLIKERNFFVEAQPDFVMSRVFVEKITREGEHVEVKAEITNNGFSVSGPVNVKFRYYNTNDQGEKFGSPIHTSEYELFGGGILNPDTIFDHGEIKTVRDNSFVAPDVDVYYVEVTVDPQ